MRILVIDDDPDALLLCRVNLEFDGHEVLEAPDGEGGFELAAREQPDVSVLDIMLPRLDGLSVLESLLRTEATREIPVVLLTAKAGAKGAKGESESDGQDVNQRADSQQNSANQRSSNKGGRSSRDSQTQTATTEDGGTSISVAAAIAFNVAITDVSASVDDDITIRAEDGKVELLAESDTDAKAEADGSAVVEEKDDNGGGGEGSSSSGESEGSGSGDGSAGGTGVGIGVAVAVNYAPITTHATLGSGTEVTAQELSVTAKVRDETDDPSDGTHTVEAKATSGAGATDIGLAGSLALNILRVDALASVGEGAQVRTTQGDADLVAGAKQKAVAEAKSKAEDGEDVGGVLLDRVARFRLVGPPVAAVVDDGVATTLRPRRQPVTGVAADAVDEQPAGAGRADALQGGEPLGVAVDEGGTRLLVHGIADPVMIELAGQAVDAAPDVVEHRQVDEVVPSDERIDAGQCLDGVVEFGERRRRACADEGENEQQGAGHGALLERVPVPLDEAWRRVDAHRGSFKRLR